VFTKIRYRLLLSYLLVFASLLGIFAMPSASVAIAVRVAFTRSLNEQVTDKLTAYLTKYFSYFKYFYRKNFRFQSNLDYLFFIYLYAERKISGEMDIHGVK
jgi:hypothetical protein